MALLEFNASENFKFQSYKIALLSTDTFIKFTFKYNKTETKEDFVSFYSVSNPADSMESEIMKEKKIIPNFKVKNLPRNL